MRLPLAREGLGVIAAAAVVLAGAGVLTSLLWSWSWAVLLALWCWIVWFFRDPQRDIQRSPNALYAPADGKVTEVVELDRHDLIAAPCVRIRIFLNLLNVHVNRVPCAARVISVERKSGRCLNAMRRQAAELNTSNTLLLQPAEPWTGLIVLRQICGVIARRIVCHARPGDQLASGERFGIIRFGSGAELVVPKHADLKILVRAGDSVYGGLTELARIEEDVMSHGT